LRMRPKLISFCLLISIILAAGSGQEKASPPELNALLKEELSLAKTPELYFILDLEARSMVLKSTGLVLEEWKIESTRTWGERPWLKRLTLLKKSALFAPKRKKIKPGEAEQGEAYELEALELKDMPSTYALYLSDGFYVYIRSEPKRFLSSVANIGHFFNWYLWVPLRNLGFELRKKSFTAIDIKLASKEDAQALYWSLADGTRGIVLSP
jgi:hypothetical protein